MLKFAVFGDPIDHSLSPEIHALFAKQLGIIIHYQRRRVVAGCLQAALTQFFNDEGGQGVNITLPLKQEAFELLVNSGGRISDRARQAEAVNTVIVEPDGIWFGDNTDGIGLLQDFGNHGIPLQNKRILLIGAGGAARGVLAELVKAEPSLLVVANRNLERAEQLVVAAKAITKQVELYAASLAMIVENPFDLIIDATSAVAYGVCLPLPQKFPGAPIFYTMMYGPKIANTLSQASSAGAVRTVDGFGMLVEQAAAAAKLFYLRPEDPLLDTAAVINVLQQK